ISSQLAGSAVAVEYTIEAGADFEAECLLKVQPGDSCYLEKGDYLHDGLTRTHGTEDKRITITGSSDACVKGSNTQDRAFQIAHSYYTIENICFDGEHGNENVATAIYIMGADRRSDHTHNGKTSSTSVTGTILSNLEIKNFGEECVHFRYFVTWTEVVGCTIQNCGIEAFENGEGGKVGEAIYLGTALSQVKDNKAPEVKLRTGSADNVDYDVCAYNWIHHNTFRTYANECVDVKEGSENNLIEYNICEEQKDENSGCFGFRGSHNTARFNDIANCEGAGVRVGGDKVGSTTFGMGNHMYGNTIKNTGNGAFNVMRPEQGAVCENTISGATAVSTFCGAYKDEANFVLDMSTGECEEYPGDLGDTASASPNSVGTGVNAAFQDSAPQEEEIPIETTASEGTPGLGQCSTVLKVSDVEVQHSQYIDHDPENLFDKDLTEYFSVNRETTEITFELEDEQEVNGIAIGFFMNDESEERIQRFSVSLRKEDDDDWTTVVADAESSGSMDIQTFPFSTRTAKFIRFESHGNSYNNWTALTEVEICGPAAAVESNALFGGVEAVAKDVGKLNADLALCPVPRQLAPRKVYLQGAAGNVKDLFDGNFQTRWSTENTHYVDDLNNDQVHVVLHGDSYLSHVNIAFFDGDLAHQWFSIYTKSAAADEWTKNRFNETAARVETLQTFHTDTDRVTDVYVVARGNDVGLFTKLSEIELWGC
ncbi:unnamed protein product, partial [Sphacelaria rigidula]